MKHKLKLLTLMLTSSVFLAGCFPTGERNIPPKTTSNTSQTENGSDRSDGSDNEDITTGFFPDGVVNMQEDNLSIDFTIPTDAPTSVQKIALKPKEYDVETVKKVILQDKTITDATEQFPGSKTTIYKTSDNCRLVAYPDSYIYIDSGVGDNSKNYGNIAQHYDKIYYSSDEELPSFSRKDAVDRVNKILDETGIENYADPYVIPINAEKANDYLEKKGGFSKTGGSSYTLWEQDEGIYVLKYPFKYNGIELCMGNLKAAGASATTVGAGITAYVTKDKIFYITISESYDVVSENAGTVNIDFDADYAANEFVNYYSKQVLTSPKYFTECKLEYVPLKSGENSEIIFTPAWCFMGHILSGPEKDIVTDCAEYYYADTGIRLGSY